MLVAQLIVIRFWSNISLFLRLVLTKQKALFHFSLRNFLLLEKWPQLKRIFCQIFSIWVHSTQQALNAHLWALQLFWFWLSPKLSWGCFLAKPMKISTLVKGSFFQVRIRGKKWDMSEQNPRDLIFSSTLLRKAHWLYTAGRLSEAQNSVEVVSRPNHWK